MTRLREGDPGKAERGGPYAGGTADAALAEVGVLDSARRAPWCRRTRPDLPDPGDSPREVTA